LRQGLLANPRPAPSQPLTALKAKRELKELERIIQSNQQPA